MTDELPKGPAVLNEALVAVGQKTKEARVVQAQQEFNPRRRQGEIVELFGKLDWDVVVDYKRERVRP
ncbi:MAG: type II toxin-antitoxin system VapB family antitoxin [Gammaproteobacteria bacterium]|nr:type II toxin-antitoxin system VapB family antitoxin [Gammaproteobacteria bacterium]